MKCTFSGLHFRGWIVMSFISILLFIAVAIPAAHISKTLWRTLYVALAAPVAWLMYNIAVYFILYRPMLRCTDAFMNGARLKTWHTEGKGSVMLSTKEIYQLNRGLHALKNEVAEMRAATALMNQQLDELTDDGP
ncbi:hypothetical protein JKF63_01171 [Porcisia hertigi]|uniref:Uncharacterized protein n=1 Tax=Porcisia hertigi TaxID=2761500 RepID=A0A836L0D9_9TRYP|nr:hypothetical protein JKF63_01171 [Porcisia hertigi]